MKIKLLVFAFFLSTVTLYAQNEDANDYHFTIIKKLDCTPVKNQGRSGTCWSFATSSFLESELLRMGKGEHNLSEMFVVRNIYLEKAINYVLRQGKANFDQGALSHDLIHAYEKYGIVPESVFNGKVDSDQEVYNHNEMVAVIKGMLEALVKERNGISEHWMDAFKSVLDVYMGSAPEEFKYEGKTYTPKSYAKSLGLNPDDYISLTSFTHHPFYSNFILEIPDNFSNGSYYNIPIDELQKVVDNALQNGYTVAWDADVSEKGFGARNGMAILPAKDWKDMSTSEVSEAFKKPVKEMDVTQENRQEAFETYATTDDHLMHITGTAEDIDGNKYYFTKNSWGKDIGDNGFLYVSQPYFRMKTIAIMVHKDAIPKDLRKKLGI